MINVGLDFGSTNTLISVYNNKTNVPEIVHAMGTESYTIPSYVAYDIKKDKYEFGAKARTRLGNKNFKVFRAFKMLLREEQDSVLKEWNYDGKNTPERIAGLFIKTCLQTALRNENETEIGTLTIGIPEIWRKPGKKNANKIILDICERLDFAKAVKLVTEPEAASAYFAFKYAETKKKSFQGHVLVVDYGGGTLDITLSKVRPGNAETKKNTKYDMQILTEERTGEGENTVDRNNGTVKVGNAGLRYMESVIDASVQAAGFDPIEEKTNRFDKYSKLIREFEEQLLTSPQDVEEAFADYEEMGLYTESVLEDLDDNSFTELTYQGEDIDISYGIMARVYKDVIYDVFEKKMKEILSYMDANGIVYKNGNSDTFQLALVGGFGNFYLVKQQLKELINIGMFDNIIAGANDCEKAITFGTALYASDIVGHTYTAPYSLGVRVADSSGNPLDAYAFHYREEVVPNKIYFVSAQGSVLRFRNANSSFKKFIRMDGRPDSGKKPMVLRLEDEYIEKQKNVVGKDTQYFNLGLSLDENDILSMHLFKYDKIKKEREQTPRSVKLAAYNDLFLPTADV